jgi:hypothetical protein
MDLCERPGEPTETCIRHTDGDVGRVQNERMRDRYSSDYDTDCCGDDSGSEFQLRHLSGLSLIVVAGGVWPWQVV